jgi:DNA-binding NtrC family response regulator
MPGIDGVELLERIRVIDPSTRVIMITAYATVETAVRSLKHGAFDYITKPVDPDELSRLVARALEDKQHSEGTAPPARAAVAEPERSSGEPIIGESPAILHTLDLIRQVASTDATVLIRGESGTGKELIARAVHRESPRRYFSLISVNCGALPESLLESELFGHEKGAFTGAAYRRKGKLELADGGTLFLDEVGTLTPKSQVDLLRVLETHELNRLGGHETIKVDFRVVCATNEDLEALVADKRFREDLYYRLNVFTIEAPPLRERVTDIPLLAEHFLRRGARTVGRDLTGFSPEALARLCAYAWPGNVRELANAVERAAIVAAGPRVELQDLPPLSGGGHAAGQGSLEEMEKLHIQRVLDEHDGNITRSARALEVDRATLYNKIKKYELRR